MAMITPKAKHIFTMNFSSNKES
uniref:Uncharacterized protein n=1 Tax=Rhizophora mucronata TaxID=61149 RepID=A0A2P2NWX9_RHIMU